MYKIFQIIVLFCILICAIARRSCIPRDYGNGATVCVCNITYCDDLDPIRKLDKGIINLFETSISGDRFTESQIRFGQNNEQKSGKSQTIKIDTTKKFQKIIGFGGAFTDAAGINIASLPTSMQLTLLENYYSAYGIEYTVGRIPIAGCDFSTYAYSYCDVAGDDNLTHFSLTKEDMLYKIPYLQLAQLMSPHKVKYFGSPWSSPAWMKTTGTFNHGGVLIGQPGGLYYQIWANYFVKFLDNYNNRGVKIWGITVENEPGSGFNKNHSFNDLGFTAETERDFVKLNLGPTLAKAGYGPENLNLMVYDDQRPSVLKWANTILGDEEAAKFVSGIAFHWYANSPDNIQQLDMTNDKYPEFFMLSTEACEEWRGKTSHVSLGNWATFERYAYDIITDLNHWTTGWVDWNLALDLEGGPNWVKNFVDAPIIVNATAYEFYKQPFFYALGHFSKFLAPNSQKVLIIEDEKIENFETTAFVRPDNATVVIALNLNNYSIDLTIDDPNNGKVSRPVKPRSLQTYIYWN